MLVNPYRETGEMDDLFLLPAAGGNCREACWQCRKSAATKELDLPISKGGLRHVLCDIFIHRKTPPDKRLLSKTILVKTLVEYKDGHGHEFNRLVFGSYTKSTAEVQCRALVLKLFATGVIVPVVSGKQLYCDLAKQQDGSPCVNNDHILNGFTFIETN
jgi:hypothetical protein